MTDHQLDELHKLRWRQRDSDLQRLCVRYCDDAGLVCVRGHDNGRDWYDILHELHDGGHEVYWVRCLQWG